jgi:hypothetical protein
MARGTILRNDNRFLTFLKNHGVVLSGFLGAIFIVFGIYGHFHNMDEWLSMALIQTGGALLGAFLGVIASLKTGDELRDSLLDIVRYRNDDSFDNENIHEHCGEYYLYHVTNTRSGLTWRRTRLNLSSGIAHGRLISKTKSLYENEEFREYNNYSYLKKDNKRFIICFERVGKRSREEASSIYIFPGFGNDNPSDIWPGVAVFQTFIGRDSISQCILARKSLIANDREPPFGVTESVSSDNFDFLNNTWISESKDRDYIVFPMIFNEAT